jgi:glucuronate isomerase
VGLKTYITDDFLLETDAARELYHGYASTVPIIDYHCHLPVAQIAQDYQFANMTRAWLEGDHYKWRAMRTNGVPESYCTGGASDWEKFEKWAETVPYTLRNPLYHWTHLELRRPFGITDRLLNPKTAKGIWADCNAMLERREFSCRGIMKQMRVALVCTTDDPCDSLEHHEAIAGDPSFTIQVLPAWRPDKGMAIEDPSAFNVWVDRLGAAARMAIFGFDEYIEALRRRHSFFHERGCRLSDHGIETAYASHYTPGEIETIFERLRRGTVLSMEESLKFKSAMLYEFAVMDFEKGWTQQFHFGALRSVNTRMLKEIGPDTGFDSVGDFPLAVSLGRFLDRLEREEKLAKTILYNLNPGDNEVLASMIGNFQDGRIPGRLQFGSAWWFLDQLDGMRRQLDALSNLGLLSKFVGMLTDSRSFLSYPRHEYFRRLLCNILGSEIQRGLLPNDVPMVGEMVRDIAFRNARDYFGFSLDEPPLSEGPARPTRAC